MQKAVSSPLAGQEVIDFELRVRRQRRIVEDATIQVSATTISEAHRLARGVGLTTAAEWQEQSAVIEDVYWLDLAFDPGIYS